MPPTLYAEQGLCNGWASVLSINSNGSQWVCCWVPCMQEIDKRHQHTAAIRAASCWQQTKAEQRDLLLDKFFHATFLAVNQHQRKHNNWFHSTEFIVKQCENNLFLRDKSHHHMHNHSQQQKLHYQQHTTRNVMHILYQKAEDYGKVLPELGRKAVTDLIYRCSWCG